MKRYPHPDQSFPAILPFVWQLLLLLLPISFFLSPRLVLGGVDRHWNGNSNTTWSTAGNWDTGVPGNTDNAVFNGSFSNQPNLTANATTGGLWMTTGVGQNVTISGSTFTLTLAGNTINGTAGRGILIDNTTTYTLTINCGLKLNNAQTWLNSSSNLFTVTGAVNTNGKALTIDGSGNTTISGVVSGNGTGSVTKTGSGTLTLSGANTYAGGTTLSSGTLNINNAGSGGTSSAIGSSTFTINGGTIDNTTSGAITLSTNNAVTFGGNFTFGGTQNLTFGTGGITNGGNRTITLNGTNSTLTFGGTMTNTSGANQTTTVSGGGNTLVLGGYALSNNNTAHTGTFNGTGNVTITGAVTNGGNGAGGLTYSGGGVLTLGGTNTYTGATTVNSGTMLVNGSTASQSTVSVNNSGTTLGGTGTINGAVTVGTGAILLGGTGSAASGTLTLNNSLTLNSGSIIQLALGASGAHSTLARTGIGAWTFNTNQAFTFINLGAQPGNYTNIITGLASDPGESGWTITNAGWIGTFSFSGGNISLNVVAVPEPATYLAGFLTVLALGYNQRRRWHSLLRRASLVTGLSLAKS